MIAPVPLQLASPELSVTVDPLRGTDLTELTDLRTGTQVLLRTPWVERATTVARHGSRMDLGSSSASWLEGYHGGMQLLCPNAGAPTVIGGLEIGFHGEACLQRWRVDSASSSEAEFSLDLFTVPLSIRRRMAVAGPVLTIEDAVTNTAPVPVPFHYQHHPAFGGPLLSPAAKIETGAQTVVVDPRSDFTPLPAGSEHPWPPDLPGTGRRLDQVPEPDAPWAMLGWLTDFAAPWAAIRNPDLDLAVALSWDGDQMPYAWLWEEFGLATGFPWYGRVRTVAIEPSTTTNAGPAREQMMVIEPGGRRDLGLRIAVGPGGQPVTGVTADGRISFT